MKRVGSGRRDIFVTTLRTPTKASIGSRVEQLKADHGHIVVRVAPGGDEYRVFVLDDTTETAPVIATFGPYVVGQRALIEVQDRPACVVVLGGRRLQPAEAGKDLFRGGTLVPAEAGTHTETLIALPTRLAVACGSKP